jgi:hypothetical protein
MRCEKKAKFEGMFIDELPYRLYKKRDGCIKLQDGNSTVSRSTPICWPGMSFKGEKRAHLKQIKP